MPEGNFAERFEYDPRGRQVLHVSFEGIVTQSVYSPLTGRLSEQRFFASEAVYANGTGSPAETTTSKSDAFGRTVEVRRTRGADIRITTTAYDPEGRVTRVATPEGAVNHRHDDLGRLVRTFTTTATGSDPIDDTRYTYDALGRLATVTVVEQNDVAPPEADRQVTTHAYDMLGNLAWQIRPDGVVAEYLYDRMNRLDKLSYHEPGWFAGYPSLPYRVLAKYDYDVRADGRREGVIEKVRFDDNADGYLDDHTTATIWTYDGLGRLVTESIDHYVDALDRMEHFVYDLTGNRLKQTVDKGRDGAATPDEVTTYGYDANDRLRVEDLDTNGDNQPERSTTYGYGHTQQTLKEVREGTTLVGRTTFTYDQQGRMEVVTATTYTGVSASQVERTTYGYGADGIRVVAKHEVDATADGAYETATRTEYLNDAHNATGYSQAVRETTVDAVTELVRKVIVYAIGHDQISQTVTEYSGGQPGTPTTLVLGSDGHGSTRFLTDLLGAIGTVGVRQLFDYDAYGNLLNIDAAEAATNILYSGEMFDARIGQQYLRARWYDATTGRFNQLDPFFGNLQDPQSLHKYLYTHGDPINYTDPSGRDSLGLSISIAIGSTLVGATAGGVIGATRAYFAGDDVYNGFNSGAFYGAGVGLSIGLGFQFGLARAALAATGVGVASLGLGFALGGRLDDMLAWGPWFIFVQGSPLLPTMALNRYRGDIKAAGAIAPPELVGSVLMYELLQYNAIDTLLDDSYPRAKHSIGIAQLRVDTVKDHGLFPGLSDYEIRQVLYDPRGAIRTLARDIQYIATDQKIDLANWDNKPEAEKRDLITRFSAAKDLINLKEFKLEPSPAAMRYGIEGYEYIKSSGVLR